MKRIAIALLLFCGGCSKPEPELTLVAEPTIENFKIEPSVFYLGELTPGKTKTASVTVSRSDKREVSIVKSDASIQLQTLKIESISAGAKITIKVAIGGPSRKVSESLMIQFSDLSNPPLVIPILGSIVGDFVADPDQLNWVISEAKLSDLSEFSKVQHFRVKSKQTSSPLIVHEASCTLKELDVSVLTDRLGMEYEITASLASIPKDSIKGSIILKTNLGEQAVPISIDIFRPWEGKPCSTPTPLLANAVASPGFSRARLWWILGGSFCFLVVIVFIFRHRVRTGSWF